MSTIVTENEAELVSQLGKLIVKASREAHKENGHFRVGVSGGSVVKFLTAALTHIETDFSHWKIFFCDERVVPVDDEESTFGVYKRELVGKVNIKEEQFVQIKQGVSADEAAEDYIQQLAAHFPPDSLPRFDLLLLGIGPDGHTCSLFPGHRLLTETNKWVSSITDSPKLPLNRITLTYPVINNAKMIIFALAGTGKADIVRKILVDNVELPATLVRPTKGQLYWILDKDAAKYL